MLDAAKVDFTSEWVSDVETMATICDFYRWSNIPGSKRCILDPNSAIAMVTALRSAEAAPDIHHVASATAHPAEFSRAVEMALEGKERFQLNDFLPEQLVGLEDLSRRCMFIQKIGRLDGLKKNIVNEIEKEPIMASTTAMRR